MIDISLGHSYLSISASTLSHVIPHTHFYQGGQIHVPQIISFSAYSTCHATPVTTETCASESEGSGSESGYSSRFVSSPLVTLLHLVCLFFMLIILLGKYFFVYKISLIYLSKSVSSASSCESLHEYYKLR